MDLQLYIEKSLKKKSIYSYLLFPLSLLFILIVKLRRLMYGYVLKRYHAPVFIISVGNLTAGGSGKTPFTIYLGKLLLNHNLNVAVSHRGYKSKIESESQLISNYEALLPEAEQAGDEAWLIASKLIGIPVIAGKNRKRAIEALLQSFPDLDCIILDDSFQHLKVKHDLDFLIVNDNSGFGNGFVLPAGYLREPISSLSYADAIIINQSKHPNGNQTALIETIKPFNKPIITGHYQFDGIYDFSGNTVSLEQVLSEKVILISGIGNPQGFEATVTNLNIQVIRHLAFTDHYAYDNPDIRQNILSELKDSKAKWLITTEKDYAKLRKYQEFKSCLLTIGISFLLDKHSNPIIDLFMRKITIKRKEA